MNQYQLKNGVIISQLSVTAADAKKSNIFIDFNPTFKIIKRSELLPGLQGSFCMLIDRTMTLSGDVFLEVGLSEMIIILLKL
jgi:hypothetical protein